MSYLTSLSLSFFCKMGVMILTSRGGCGGEVVDGEHWPGAHCLIQGVRVKGHPQLSLVSSGALQGLSAPPASPSGVLRDSRGRGGVRGVGGLAFRLLSVQGHCPPAQAQPHPQSGCLDLPGLQVHFRIFLPQGVSKFEISHWTCGESVKTVPVSGWGLSEPLFTSGFGRPGPCCDSPPSLMIMLCTEF